MDSKETLSKILAIEKNFEVNELRYMDVRVWPYYRTILFDLFKNSQESSVKRSNETEANLGYSFSREDTLEFPSESLEGIHSLALQAGRSLGEQDLFFLCDSRFQITHDDHFHTHKFFSPIYQSLPKEINGKFLLSDTWPEEKIALIDSPIERSYRIDEDMSSLAHLRSSIPLSHIHRDLFEFIQKEFPGHLLDYKSIEGVLQFICLAASYFKIILQEGRARVSLSSVIPSVRTFAFILGSRLAGVPSVEVQHGIGGGGEVHPVYNHWSVVPREGYHLLPKYFWCWGEKSKSGVTEWTDDNDFHQAFVGGNPWLPNIIQLTDEEKAKKTGGRKRILVSLQNYDIPYFLLEGIKHFREYEWFFLCHPLHNHLFDKYNSHLNKHLAAFDNWSISHSRKNEFYTLIKDATVLITGFSTTAYEALVFGVPTILIHENSLFEISQYIKKGVFRYAGKFEDLHKILIEMNFSQEETPFIESSNLGMDHLLAIMGREESMTLSTS